MCELKVYLESKGNQALLTEIVFMKKSEKDLLLKDVLGKETRVKDVFIDEVNITEETVILKKLKHRL